MALMSSRALGKRGHSHCWLAARGPWLPKGEQPQKALRTDSVFMATKVALLSFKQKEPSSRKVGHSGIVSLPLSKNRLSRGHSVIPPTRTPCPWFLHGL